jgi:hypothetical protein
MLQLRRLMLVMVMMMVGAMVNLANLRIPVRFAPAAQGPWGLWWSRAID